MRYLVLFLGTLFANSLLGNDVEAMLRALKERQRTWRGIEKQILVKQLSAEKLKEIQDFKDRAHPRMEELAAKIKLGFSNDHTLQMKRLTQHYKSGLRDIMGQKLYDDLEMARKEHYRKNKTIAAFEKLKPDFQF